MCQRANTSNNIQICSCIYILDLQPSSPEHVSGWTAGQVIEWLKMIKMGEHIKLFQQKEVDGAELVQYDSKCLIGIGVKKKNDQSKIISELNKLLK